MTKETNIYAQKDLYVYMTKATNTYKISRYTPKQIKIHTRVYTKRALFIC